jgi:hypothetical protein
MTSIQQCIYRNKSNLRICKCNKFLNSENDSKFCIKHINTEDKLVKLYNHIYDIIKYKKNIELYDYYYIFKNIEDKYFITMMVNLSKNNLLLLFEKYIQDKKKRKLILIKNIITLFNNTLNIEKNLIETVTFIQKKFRMKKLLEFANNEDPFSFTPLNEIPIDSIFIYKEDDKKYGFDAIELFYFIEKNIKEGVEPYNPYTRKKIDNSILVNLELFITNNKLIKKDINKCMWISNLHAFTELSLVIEKAGFYNSPQWFLKLKNKEIITIIKLYYYLSNDKNHFNFKNKGNDSLIFYFCKESIKLFNDYNNNYILCCNFIKSLSIISSEFYNNLPEWIIDIETSQRNILDINNFLVFYYISINEQ